MKLRLKSPLQLSLLCSSQLCSTARQPNGRCSFGIAFDIDGVILRGRIPIGNSPKALRKLYHDNGRLKIPFLFLTNGGGIPESRRAFELSEILGVKIMPSQVVHGHTPFRTLWKRFENDLIVATGKGQPAAVMSEYGFKRVVSLEEYASYFENIDPVAQYKGWGRYQVPNVAKESSNLVPSINVNTEKVEAAFVVSDPVDWGRDIQAAFPSERLGMGAFRIALESVFNRIHHKPLEYTIFGKPKPFVFKNAEAILKRLHLSSCGDDILIKNSYTASHAFKTLYMIGDNPLVDIKGAKQAGEPWFSILTRTGVFKQRTNHAEFLADLVVDTVEQAVDYILNQ